MSRKAKSSLSKLTVGVSRAGIKDMSELMFVRYMGVALKHLKGDEGESLRFCCEVFGYSAGEGSSVWNRRNEIIARNEADFVASDDILKGAIRGLYIKLVEALTNRDYSSASIKEVIEALRAVASLEVGVSIARGISLDDGGASGVLPGGVQVSRSNVIIVPMPDSAQSRVKDVGDRLVSNEGMGGASGEYYEGKKKKHLEMQLQEERMVEDVKLDLVEEFKKVESRIINGEEE